MIDGGQHTTSIDTHLQTGSELFESDPKGALAAYYQAVSLDASHIEGWNQIGRLMFDLEQYSEAEMVFKRVESLANEQNLPDWAEMATQNIALAQQSHGEPGDDQPAAQEPVQTEAVQNEVELSNTSSEEAKSIEDISNIAAVAELPQTAEAIEAVAVPEVAIANVVQETGFQIPSVEAPAVVMPTPAAEEVVADIALPNVALPNVALPDVVQPAFVPPVISAPPNPAPLPVAPEQGAAAIAPAAFIAEPQQEVAVPVASVESVQAAPMLPPAAPPMPYPEVPSVGIQPAIAPITTTLPEAAHQVADPMTMPPVAKLGQLQGQQLPPPANPFPANPFPAQPAAAMTAPPVPPMPAPAQPETTFPAVDAEMDAPKSGSGKLALMITGVVGAIGIGLGAAQYMGAKDSDSSSIPVIKSDAKLATKNIKIVELAPSQPATPEPSAMGRDLGL